MDYCAVQWRTFTERSSCPRVYKAGRADFSPEFETSMDKSKRKRTAAEALKTAVRRKDFREYMASGHPGIPTDERFDELLKRLDKSEKPKG